MMKVVKSPRDLKVGDLVIHEYRKTLAFKVTELCPKIKVRRVNAHNEVIERYKGYVLSRRDFLNGLVQRLPRM